MDVQRDIEIKASIREVWQILSDIRGYLQWNKSMQLTLDDEERDDLVTFGIAAATRAGTRHQWQLGGKLRPFREPEQVSWVLGVGGILDLGMVFDLEAQGLSTMVRFTLQVRGLAAPFARRRLARLLADPMSGTLRDLKRVAEGDALRSSPKRPAKARVKTPRRRFR